MTLAAATATRHTSPVLVALVLLAIALAAAAGYVTACAWWPFAACRRCAGAGKRRSPSGKAWCPCRRCKGTGARVRLGRRLWTYARRRAA